ncbi:hypothetical protein GGR58DRAFT_185923 [Xylaria digitata]|nr:hypothetical protein GGR58DRAFT_185923 [Xylaria digitata]
MTVLPPDPYKVLGVSRDAQIPEIRSAHRKLVLKCHPDKIQDPALKEAKQTEFQQVQQAYELLSNEVEREKYDRRAEVYEHARERDRERAKTSAARATSSTPKRESPLFYHVNVKDASPRANTFATSSPYGRTPPRSWEDTSSGARMFEEAKRQARKTASYEKEKPSKRDEERRRREADKEWAREKEKANEREARDARKARERKEEKERSTRDREEREKEKRKEEKKKSHSDREREREKERKSATAEKLRSRQPIIEETSDSMDSSDEDDVIYEPPPPKTDRKKSSSGRKPEEIDPPSTSERTRKLSGNMETAIRYLHRSGGKPPSFIRAQTYTEGSSTSYNPMVPTPPPATNAPFAPPPPVEEPEEMSEDDMARRSAARPSRRMSHDTPRSSREKASLHKKSSSSRDHQPIIVEVGSPPSRAAPPLSRAHTDSYARPIPVPGMSRADTWYSSTDRERERHERSRSRPTPGYTDSDESEDDRDRRHRRSRRTQSPEPISAHAVRYSVDTNGTKSIPIRQKQYHEQPPRGSYKTKGGGYAVPNSSARLHRGHTVAYHYEEERPQQHFSGVKYSAQFGEQDIRYSDLPYKGSYRPDVFA